MKISQGTISALIGCHSISHSVLVILAWKQLFGFYPKPWEIICIFLHDIGHFGLDYLDNPEQKAIHWRLGARVAGKLFGTKGYWFCASHDSNSPYCNPEKHSHIFKADKYSPLLSPHWFDRWCCIVEPKLNTEESINKSIHTFKNQVRKNVENGFQSDNHDFYLNRRKD